MMILRSCRRAIPVAITLIMCICARAQSWQLVKTIEIISDSLSVDRTTVELEGGTVIFARSGSQGGDVRLFGKNVGGADQWDLFDVLSSAEAAFASDIALMNGTLAVGSSGDPNTAISPGSVSIHTVDASDIDPLVALATLIPANGVGGDRFGHALHWSGDSLLVGAPGRNHPDGTGAVYVFKHSGATWTELAMIQPDPATFPLPALYGFGHDIASSGTRMVVASPGSGYAQGLGSGALHLYDRSANEASGWAAAAVVYDLSLVETVVNGDTFTAFATGDLGGTGLFLIDTLLIADAHSPMDLNVQEACTACPMRAFRKTADDTWTPSPGGAPETVFPRSRNGTTVQGHEALLNGLDAITGLWYTTAWRYMPDGTWSLQETLWAADSCTRLNGPIVLDGDRFARLATRTGELCAVTAGEHAWSIEIFERASTVSISTTVPQPSSLAISGEQLLLTTDLVGSFGIHIRSMSGTGVLELSATGPGTVRLPIATIAPGMYLLQLDSRSNGRQTATRFVVP